nr:60S ribosomal protein L28-like [Oryctolagus cuniculus]
MSTHLQQMVMPNCSSFLSRGSSRHNTEPSNPKAHNSFLYNMLNHHKTMAVELVADSRGTVVVMKWTSSQ